MSGSSSSSSSSPPAPPATNHMMIVDFDRFLYGDPRAKAPAAARPMAPAVVAAAAASSAAVAEPSPGGVKPRSRPTVGLSKSNAKAKAKPKPRAAAAAAKPHAKVSAKPRAKVSAKPRAKVSAKPPSVLAPAPAADAMAGALGFRMPGMLFSAPGGVATPYATNFRITNTGTGTTIEPNTPLADVQYLGELPGDDDYSIAMGQARSEEIIGLFDRFLERGTDLMLKHARAAHAASGGGARPGSIALSAPGGIAAAFASGVGGSGGSSAPRARPAPASSHVPEPKRSRAGRVPDAWPDEPLLAAASSSSSSSSGDDHPLQCQVCTQRKISTICRPCNHACLCVACARACESHDAVYSASGFRCPMCRESLTGIERVYF